MTWAWFRPSEEAWDDGAHWYRCDVVGGGEQSKAFVALPDDRQGPAARQARRPVAGLRRRPHRHRVGEDPVQPASTPGARSPRSCSARQPTPTPATGSRGPHPRLLLGLGRRLAELPGRLRLRLHVVPRGRVEGRQPPLGLLGEDDAVSRRAPLGDRCLAVAPARRLHRRLRRRPRRPRGRRPRPRRRPRRRPAPRRRRPRPPPRGAAGGPATGSRTAQLTQPTNDAAPVACRRGTPPARSTSAGWTPSSTGTRWPSTRRPVQRQLATTCPRKLAEYVGGSRRPRAT